MTNKLEASIPNQCKDEETLWDFCKKNNSIEFYQQYIKEYPMGKHIYGAKNKIESLFWEQCLLCNDIKYFEKYIKLFPNGHHIYEAKDKLETILWKECNKFWNTNLYNVYLYYFPYGKHAQEAKYKIEKKRTKVLNSIFNKPPYISIPICIIIGLFVMTLFALFSELMMALSFIGILILLVSLLPVPYLNNFRIDSDDMKFKMQLIGYCTLIFSFSLIFYLIKTRFLLVMG